MTELKLLRYGVGEMTELKLLRYGVGEMRAALGLLIPLP